MPVPVASCGPSARKNGTSTPSLAAVAWSCSEDGCSGTSSQASRRAVAASELPPPRPAATGIRFTILAPRQANRWRRIGTQEWHSNDGIDPSRAYLCKLPSGNSICLFFYDGPLSADRLAEGLAVALRHVPVFAGRLRTADDGLRIVCDDGGVPLTVAGIDDPLFGFNLLNSQKTTVLQASTLDQGKTTGRFAAGAEVEFRISFDNVFAPDRYFATPAVARGGGMIAWIDRREQFASVVVTGTRDTDAVVDIPFTVEIDRAGVRA